MTSYSISAQMKPFKAIAAMSLNRVIGNGNRIPWHLPEDFKWFKATTMGHIIVMGRKTFESIGRPLPGRETIVLSRGPFSQPGVRVARNLEELLAWVEAEQSRTVFIAGGAQIYEATLGLCSDLFLTVVKREVEGDVLFPKFEPPFKLADTVQDNEQFKILHFVNRTSTGSRMFLGDKLIANRAGIVRQSRTQKQCNNIT
jgi:dihydrofolate reductase